MLKTSILTAVALLGLAAAPAAQVRVAAQVGKTVRVGAQVGNVEFAYHGRSPKGRFGQRSFRGRRHYRSGRHGNHRHTGNRRYRQQPTGYWRTVRERVCVPGYFKTVHVPAQYGWTYDECGRRIWAIVTPACQRQVWCEERWEWRTRRVWCAY